MGKKRSAKKGVAEYTMRYLNHNGEWAFESYWDDVNAAVAWATAKMKKHAFSALRLHRADGTIAHRWGKDELTPLEVWAHERGITGPGDPDDRRTR
jgi:hypothetical protein